MRIRPMIGLVFGGLIIGMVVALVVWLSPSPTAQLPTQSIHQPSVPDTKTVTHQTTSPAPMAVDGKAAHPTSQASQAAALASTTSPMPAQLDAKAQYTAMYLADSHRLSQDKIDALLTQTQQLKQQGASAEQLYALRRRYMDEPLAKRLGALDKEDDAFVAKLNQYLQLREQVRMGQGEQADAAQTASAITALQHELFDSHEQSRLADFIDN